MSEILTGMQTFHVTDSFVDGYSLFQPMDRKVAKYLEERERTDEVETDETFQQFVIYVTISTEDKSKWLYYSRKKMGESEERLSEYLSLGFGGHINNFDFQDAEHCRAAFYKAAIRELSEEVPLLKRPLIESLGIKGWIRDRTSPVGRVHLGVYAECVVSDEVIHDLGFSVLPVSSFDLLSEKFEKWSRIILKKEGIIL